MSAVRELLIRAQGTLLLIDELNRREGVAEPLHEAMEFVDRALKEEMSAECGVVSVGARGSRRVDGKSQSLVTSAATR